MEELTGFEPALMVLQTISLTNLDTTPPKNGWDVWIRTRACRSQSPVPYRLGYVPIYNIWWAEQDLNLQVVSDQRFSRLLPHHPDFRHILVRPTRLELVLAETNCPLKTACLPNSTRSAYFILKLEADGLKPSCHLL